MRGRDDDDDDYDVWNETVLDCIFAHFGESK